MNVLFKGMIGKTKDNGKYETLGYGSVISFLIILIIGMLFPDNNIIWSGVYGIAIITGCLFGYSLAMLPRKEKK